LLIYKKNAFVDPTAWVSYFSRSPNINGQKCGRKSIFKERQIKLTHETYFFGTNKVGKFVCGTLLVGGLV
jgi:hypothetical protein